MPRSGLKWLALLLVPLGIGLGAANVGSWRPRRVFVPGDHFQVAFSPDGKRVAMASQSSTEAPGRVTVWNCTPPSRFRAPMVGPSRTFSVQYPCSICFSGDSKTLVCVDYDVNKTIHRWNLATGQAAKALHSWGGFTGLFAQSKPKTNSVTYWTGESIEQRDVKSGHVKKRIELSDDSHYEENPREIIDFSPDGKTTAWPVNSSYRAATDTRSEMDLLWEERGALLLRNTSGHDTRLPPLSPRSDTIGCTVTALTFSPESRFLAKAWDATLTDKAGNDSSSSRVTLWDLQTRKVAAKWTETHESIRAHAFSPNGTLLAAARADGAVSLREARTGQLKRLLKTAREKATSVAFSPDGLTLAACSSDGALYLWRVR